MLSACVGGKAELCCHHPGRLLAARVPPDAVLDPAPRLYPTGESTTCPAASRSYPPPLQTAPSGSRAGRGHLDQPGLAFPGSSFVASVVKSNLLCLLVQRDVEDISKGHLTVDRGPEVRSRGLYLCKPSLVSGLACLVRGLVLPNKPAVGCSFTGLGCALSPSLICSWRC